MDPYSYKHVLQFSQFLFTWKQISASSSFREFLGTYNKNNQLEAILECYLLITYIV